MNDEIIISAKNLSKTYSVSESILPFRRKDKTISALNGVDLEIKKGDIVGIIGRNGSGKSTLLKILSQTTKPTTGKAIISGKVVSAIEVSGGFNPDITGIENIKLIGQIWGLTLSKINELETTIIEFANLANFIFLPVKKLSTGMISRLAASIIINLEADIYIFDETLNGSDQLFTRKINHKLIEHQRNNKTVLITSHKITDLFSLCNKSILLEQGKIAFEGNPFEAILCYQKLLRKDINNVTISNQNILKNKQLEIRNLSINKVDEEHRITFTLKSLYDTNHCFTIFIIINNSFDLPIGSTSIAIPEIKGDTFFSCNLPDSTFRNGTYILTFAILINKVDWVFFPKVFEFETKCSEDSHVQYIPGINITNAKWELNN